MTRPNNISIAKLADLVGRDPIWLGGVLSRLGIEINRDGSVGEDLLCSALEQAASLRSFTISKEALEESIEEQTRQEMIRQFEKSGLQLLSREKRYDALMVFRKPDGNNVRIFSYIASTARKNGQCGFTISHLAREDFDWTCFAAVPYKKFFLRPRDELVKQSVGSILPRVSISYGSRPHKDEFQKRIGELLDSGMRSAHGINRIEKGGGP